MMLDETDSFFSFLGEVDGPTLMPVSSPPPAGLSPASVQPPIGDDLSPAWSVPNLIVPVSPLAPEVYFDTQVNPLSVAPFPVPSWNEGYQPGPTTEGGLEDLIGHLGSGVQSPSLAPAPIPRPIGATRPTFQSLTDLESVLGLRSSGGGSSALLLPALAVAAALLLLD